MTDSYDFNERFQFKILSLLVLVPNFQHNYGTVVLPEYFENSIHADLCSIISTFATKYRVAPSRENLEQLIMAHCRKARYNRTDPQYMDQMVRMGRALFHSDLADKQSIIDQVVDFSRDRAMKMVLLEATDMFADSNGNLSKEDYEKIYAKFNRVRTVGEGVGNLGTNTFSIMAQLPKQLNNGSMYSSASSIKTPFKSFDDSRTARGLGPGETFYIIGSSGQGKSMVKNSMGLRAAIQIAPKKRWVAHATLELSEMDNHLRYAANILNLDMDEIASDEAKFARRIKEMSLTAKIMVKWFRPITTTPGMIGNWLDQLSAEMGAPPGMLIVDYPDKMRPSEKKAFTGNLFQDGATISDELIGLCMDYKIPGVFSSQLQRAMQYSDEATGADVATSIAKIYNADAVGIMQQSREQKLKGLAKIFWDKNRRGRDSFDTWIAIDYAKAKVTETVKPEVPSTNTSKVKKHPLKEELE